MKCKGCGLDKHRMMLEGDGWYCPACLKDKSRVHLGVEEPKRERLRHKMPWGAK